MFRKSNLYLKMLAPVLLTAGLAACGFTPVSATPVGPTPPPLPTSTTVPEGAFVCQAGVIEQSFEHGFMFWVGHTTEERCSEQHAFAPGSGEVWVAILDKAGKSGQWLIFVDDWQEGIDSVDDPSLTPPEDLSQPVRGFGKIWRVRLTEEQRTALGWATGTELPFTTDYQYESASFKNAQGEVIDRPGKHSLHGLAKDLFEFDETSRTVTRTKRK